LQKDEKHQVILDSALTQFAQYGLRKTSMLNIAEHAGLSRASIYSYFKNKDQIFRSVSIDIHESGLREARVFLKDPSSGDVTSALTEALYARHGRFLALVLESPNGAEMEDEHSRLCGDVVVSTQKQFNDHLARYINMAEAAKRICLSNRGLSAVRVVSLLNLSAVGCKRGCKTPNEYKARIADLVTLFADGLVV
jgi:AcrR family transcriptional regulator